MRIGIREVVKQIKELKNFTDAEEFWTISEESNATTIKIKINACLSILNKENLEEHVIKGLLAKLEMVARIETGKALLDLMIKLDEKIETSTEKTLTLNLSTEERSRFLALIRKNLHQKNPINSIKQWSKDYEKVDDTATEGKIKETVEAKNEIIAKYYEQIVLYRYCLKRLFDMALKQDVLPLEKLDSTLILDWAKSMTEPQQRAQLAQFSDMLIALLQTQKLISKPPYLDALYIALHDFVLTNELHKFTQCFYQTDTNKCREIIKELFDEGLKGERAEWDIENIFRRIKTYFLLIPSPDRGGLISSLGNILHWIFRKVTALEGGLGDVKLIPLYDGYMNLLLFVLDNTEGIARLQLLHEVDGNSYTPLKILMQSIGDGEDVEKVNPFILQMAAPLIKYSHDLSAFKSEMGFIQYNMFQTIGLIATNMFMKKDAPLSNTLGNGLKIGLLFHGMSRNARYFKMELFNKFVHSFKELSTIPLDNVILIGKIKEGGVPPFYSYNTDLALKEELNKVPGLQKKESHIYTTEDLEKLLNQKIEYEQKIDIYLQLQSTYHSLLFAQQNFSRLGFENKFLYTVAGVVTEYLYNPKLSTYNMAIENCERAIAIVVNSIQEDYKDFYNDINKFVRGMHEMATEHGVATILDSQLMRDCLEEVQFLVRNKRIFLDLKSANQLHKVFNDYEHFRLYNQQKDNLELKDKVIDSYKKILTLCRTEKAYKPTLEDQFFVKIDSSSSTALDGTSQIGAKIFNALGGEISAGAMKRMALSIFSKIGAVMFEGVKYLGTSTPSSISLFK